MMRLLLSLALACTVAFSSVQMAVARGQAMPVDSIVICAGHGLVTVLVDAEGQPTGAAHLCPDCAMQMFAAAPSHMGAQALEPHWQPILWHSAATPAAHQGAPRPAARGPPALI